MKKVKEIPSFAYDPSCVLYVPLWERDGNTFVSDDAVGRLCTVTGATWDIQGRTFDGTGNYIDCGTISTSLQGDTPKTIIAWLYPNGILANDFAVAIGAPTTNESLLLGFNNAAGVTKALVTTAGGANDNLGATITEQNWMMLAGLYDAPNLKISVNAGTQTLKNITSTNTGSPATLLGKHSSGEHFHGIIGEVSIYNRALTPQELQQNYLSTKWRYQ